MDLSRNQTNWTRPADALLMNLGITSLIEFDELFSPAKLSVDRYVTPLIYAIGFPGNIISFLVWTRKDMRSSSGCYLAALALDDVLFFCLHVIFELKQAWGIPTLDVAGWCEMFPPLFLATQYLSLLLVLGFTVDRFIGLWFPDKRATFSTPRRAFIVVVVLTAVSLCLSLIQAYFYKFIGYCSLREELLTDDPKSLVLLWNLSLEMILFLFVPCVVLVLNVLTILNLMRRENSSGDWSTEACAPTTMLLVLSFYQIATSVPVAVTTAMQFNFPTGRMDILVSDMQTDPQWQGHLNYSFARTCINEYGMTRHALNAIFYIIMGQAFRKELRQIFCLRKF